MHCYCMWWENDPLQSVSKSVQQTEKSRKIESSQITALFFWCFPKPIRFSNRDFRFFRVNSKYPSLLLEPLVFTRETRSRRAQGVMGERKEGRFRFVFLLFITPRAPFGHAPLVLSYGSVITARRHKKTIQRWSFRSSLPLTTNIQTVHDLLLRCKQRRPEEEPANWGSLCQL